MTLAIARAANESSDRKHASAQPIQLAASRRFRSGQVLFQCYMVGDQAIYIYVYTDISVLLLARLSSFGVGNPSFTSKERLTEHVLSPPTRR